MFGYRTLNGVFGWRVFGWRVFGWRVLGWVSTSGRVGGRTEGTQNDQPEPTLNKQFDLSFRCPPRLEYFTSHRLEDRANQLVTPRGFYKPVSFPCLGTIFLTFPGQTHNF